MSTPVKKKASELNLKIYQPESVNSKESINIIKRLNPDCIVVAIWSNT